MAEEIFANSTEEIELVGDNYCETCRIVLAESSLREHCGHRITSVDKFASGVKAKLHGLLSKHEQDEKNLLKALSIATDCNERITVATKGAMIEKIYSAVGSAIEKCKKDFDEAEMGSIDTKKDVELKQKRVDEQVQEVQGKQVLIRSLLAMSMEDLASKIEGIYADGSLYMPNVELNLPYPTESASAVEEQALNENDDFSQELADLISKHVKKMKLKPVLSSIHLGQSRNLSLGVTLFRKFLQDGAKMASCDNFMCIGYIDKKKGMILLEFISKNDLKSTTLTVETNVESLVLFSSPACVGVKANEGKILVYEEVDKEPTELLCELNFSGLIGIVKVGDDFVFLNYSEESGEFYWTPGNSLPKLASVSGYMWGTKYVNGVEAKKFEFNASFVSTSENNQPVIICVCKRGMEGVCLWKLDETRSLYVVQNLDRRISRGIGAVYFQGFLDSIYHINFWLSEKGLVCKEMCQLKLSDTGISLTDDHKISNLTIEEPVVDVHCWNNSCFFKTRSNQLIKIDNPINNLERAG